MKTKCAPLIISALYRPPNTKIDIFDKIEILIHNIDGENKETILLGDMNCDLLSDIRSHETKRLLDITSLFQMTQLITNPTRVTKNTSTLVDWLLTNKPESICNSGVIHLGVSDHSLIYGCRKIVLRRNPPKMVESRSFKYYKSPAFKADLNVHLSMCDCATDDPNVLWNQFRDVFRHVADFHAPLRSRLVRSTYAPWLNKEIKKCHELPRLLEEKSS